MSVGGFIACGGSWRYSCWHGCWCWQPSGTCRGDPPSLSLATLASPSCAAGDRGGWADPAVGGGRPIAIYPSISRSPFGVRYTVPAVS